MKPISAYIGHVRADKNVVTKRSYWWMRTDSGKLIWPSQKYVKVEIPKRVPNIPPTTIIDPIL